jgi:hypothetical protein
MLWSLRTRRKALGVKVLCVWKYIMKWIRWRERYDRESIAL